MKQNTLYGIREVPVLLGDLFSWILIYGFQGIAYNIVVIICCFIALSKANKHKAYGGIIILGVVINSVLYFGWISGYLRNHNSHDLETLTVSLIGLCIILSIFIPIVIKKYKNSVLQVSTEENTADDNKATVEISRNDANAIILEASNTNTNTVAPSNPDTVIPLDINKDSNEQPTKATEQALPNTSSNPTKSVPDGKVKYCSKCGAPINPDSKICSGCGKKYFSLKGSFRWIAGFLIIALLAGNAYQFYNSKERIKGLTERNDELLQESSKAKKERDSFKKERDSYKSKSDRYTDIEKWVRKYGTQFNKDANYHTWSNTISVKVGETVKLGVYYKGNRNCWLGTTNNNCSAEWTKNWNGNTTYVELTGLSVGTNELQFSLGNSKESDSTVSFRVLVVITD